MAFCSLVTGILECVFNNDVSWRVVLIERCENKT